MSYCELTMAEQPTLQRTLAQQMSFRAIARLLRRASLAVKSVALPVIVSRIKQIRLRLTSQHRRPSCRPKRKRLPGTECFKLIPLLITPLLKRSLSSEQIAAQLNSMVILLLRDAYVYKETFSLPFMC